MPVLSNCSPKALTREAVALAREAGAHWQLANALAQLSNAEAALASLQQPNDNQRVAEWITRFVTEGEPPA